MTFSKIDWVVMWKWYHDQFFLVYLALGIPLRFAAARRFGGSGSRKSLSVVLASFASSIFSTWLPVIPIICVAALDFAAGDSAGESLLVGVPLVAFSMGIETALLDAALFRVLSKESVKNRFASLLIANILNASIALALGLAWAFHHPPIVVAAADSWR
jgi:hypothetical protein